MRNRSYLGAAEELHRRPHAPREEIRHAERDAYVEGIRHAERDAYVEEIRHAERDGYGRLFGRSLLPVVIGACFALALFATSLIDSPATAQTPSAGDADRDPPSAGRRGRGPGPHGHGCQGGRGYGRGRGGGGPHGHGRADDPVFQADREMFHFLLDHRDEIRREVKVRNDGVETLTESDNKKVARKIQEHVAAMHRRVTEPDPIRMRDPLFAEIFRHAAKIEMQVEKTRHGVRVIETSSDPFVAKLIQAHAKVVSRFIDKGYPEARANHEVPR